jgi:hypothetical protein
MDFIVDFFFIDAWWQLCVRLLVQRGIAFMFIIPGDIIAGLLVRGLPVEPLPPC